MSNVTSLRMRVLPQVPARISGANGLKVERDGLDFVVSPDTGSLIQVPSISDFTHTVFQVYNSETDSYSGITGSNLLENFQGEIIGENLAALDSLPVTESDVPYFLDGDGNASTYKVSSYVRSVSNAPDESSFVSAIGALSPITGQFRTPTFSGASAAAVPVTVSRVFVEDRNAPFKYVASEPSHALKFQNAGRWFEIDVSEISLENCGAKNDGVTADDAAWDRAYNWCMAQPNGGTMIVDNNGSGIRLAAPHNIFPYKPLEIRWEKGARLLCDITGAASIMLDASHPTTPGTRGLGLLISGPSFIIRHPNTENQIVAKFFRMRHASDLKIDGSGHNWIQYGDNTCFEITAAYNCDLSPLTVWGAGHRKPRKSTGTALFSINQGSTTLTANTATFAAGDVGDIFITGDETFTISGFTNSTTVTVSSAATRTITSRNGSFGSVTATTTAGSATVPLSANVLTAADIGRDVFIMDAVADGNTRWVHRCTITAQTGNSMTVTPAVPAAVTNAEIVFSPAGILWDEVPVDGNTTADLVWYGLHFEECRGTLFMSGFGNQIQLPELKLHANNNASNQFATDYCAVLSRSEIIYSDGIAEGTVCGRHGRIVVAGTGAQCFFDQFQGVAQRKKPYIHARYLAPTGGVHVNNIMVADGLDASTIDRIVEKVGPDGFVKMTGKVYGSTQAIDYPIYDGPRMPSTYVPGGTAAYEARNGAANRLLVSAGASPIYAGLAFNGTVEQPTSSPDFAALAQFAGLGLAPAGNVLEAAKVWVRGRNPHDAIVQGEIIITIRAFDGSYVDRWIINQGGIYPLATNTYDIGASDAQLRKLFTRGLNMAGLPTTASGLTSGDVWNDGGTLKIVS